MQRHRVILAFVIMSVSPTLGVSVHAQDSLPPTTNIPATQDSLRIAQDTEKLVLTRVRSTKRGAKIGAITGGTVGLVGGTIVASEMSTLFGGRRNSARALAAGVLVGAGGALSWGIIGAGVGSLFHHDEWKRVSVQGTTVSIAF